MKNKSDAPKRDTTEKDAGAAASKLPRKSGKGRNAEFKPFWETDAAKSEPKKPAAATGQPRTASRKSMPKPTAKAVTAGDAAAQTAAPAKSTYAERKPASRPVRPKGYDDGPAASGEHKAPGKFKGESENANMHSGQVLELKIASTTNEGFGVAMHEGKRVLVAGGLPGEVLVARVTYVGRREAFANTLKCLKVSPDRLPSPACGLGRVCDTCGLMQMRYGAQLAWKKSLVTREIRKYPSLGEARIFDTLASPKELNYRNTAKLVVSGKFSDPVIGIYRRNSHDVLDIGDCSLHHPLINKVVRAARAGIKKGKVQIYNPKSEMGLLRYLVVRVAEPADRVMVILVTSDQGYNEMHHLAKHIQQAVPEVVVISQNINATTGNVIFGQKDRFITREQTLSAYVGDKCFTLSPHSFFQVNSGAAQIIYEKVRELAALTGVERVVDVYCGIGGISLFLAGKAKEVLGIEFVEAAVADATENAKLNRARNCRFEAGDAAHLISEIGEGEADLIVLNPPRKGCEERVLQSVASIKPARIIYVSCSPETLSRDLDILSRLNYRTLEVHPVDMFPQTIHVEDVVLLERIVAEEPKP